MKTKKRIALLAFSLSSVLSWSCEKKDPQPENTLVHGKWSATHEAKMKDPSTQPGPIGTIYMEPSYKISGGDSLFWEMSASGEASVKDNMVFRLNKYSRVGYKPGEFILPEASPAPVPEQRVKWESSEQELRIKGATNTHLFTIEKLDQDSLVLVSKGVLTDGRLIRDNIYDSRVRLARIK